MSTTSKLTTELPVWLINYSKSTVSFSDLQHDNTLTHEDSLTHESNCPFSQFLLVLIGTERKRSQSKHHAAINSIVNRQLQAGGRVIFRSQGKRDVLKNISKWKEFQQVADGVYANFSGDSMKSITDKLCSLPTSSPTDAPNNTLPQQVCPVFHELGDHADNVIARASALRKKAVPIEEHFDDCGDDVSAITVDESKEKQSYFENESTCLGSDNDTDTDLEENDSFYNSCFFGSYMWGSECESNMAQSQHQLQSFAETFVFLQQTRHQRVRHDFLEVFGGEGGVCRIAIRQGLTGGRNLDLQTGFDLSKPHEITLLFQYLDEFQPHVIILAPPCTAFGAWARYNRAHAYEAWCKSYRTGLPLAKLASRIFNYQITHGRHAILENPWGSDIWKLPEYVSLLAHPCTVVAYVDQCAFGLKDFDNMLMKKPTGFMATDERLIAFLRRRCSNDHQHALVAGSSGGTSRSRQAQVWPIRLCEAIVKGIVAVLRQRHYFYPATVVKFQCPACRGHAAQDDSRHTRDKNCKFPAVAPSLYDCMACKTHKHSKHPLHDRIAGRCRYAGVSRNTSSRGPQVPRSHLDEASAEQSLGEPPPCQLGSWWPVKDDKIWQMLNAMMHTDGWVQLPQGPAVVNTEASQIRTVAPQFSVEVYTRRSVYGHFPELADRWWQIEANQPATHVRSIGYAVPTLVILFHAAQPPSSVKFKPDKAAGAPPSENPFSKLLDKWDVEEDIADEKAKQEELKWYGGDKWTADWWEERPTHYIRHHVVQRFALFTPLGTSGSPSKELLTGERITEVTFNDGQRIPDIRDRYDDELNAHRALDRSWTGKTRFLKKTTTMAPTIRNPIAADDHAEEELPPPIDEQDPSVSIPVPDWTSWDLGNALRNLRGQNRPIMIRTLRKLHIRWWHASADRLANILTLAGLPKEVIDAARDVVSTCRVCRTWSRPAHRAQATLRLSTAFNDTVQVDLLFIDTLIVLHMCDECLRWSAAKAIADKKPSTMLSAMVEIWFGIFGAPRVIISDHEGAMLSEETSIFLERWGCTIRPKPVGSHAQIVERHHELVRQTFHRVKSQLLSENIEAVPEQILSESIFAHNALVTVHGNTPYVGLLGRTPNLLVEFEEPTVSQVSDQTGAASSRHIHRVREIVLQQMIEGTARERLKRAAATQARPSAEMHELAPGDRIDIYRTPKTKDLTAWRGPATVVNVNNLSSGYVDAEWGGRVLSVRIADLRKSLCYIATLDNTNFPLQELKEHSLSINDSIQTYCMVLTERGWRPSKAAAEYPDILRAAIYVGHETFGIRCIGCRIGHGVPTIPALSGVEIQILLWWPTANTLAYRTITTNSQSLHLRQIIGSDFGAYRWIQFVGCSEDTNKELRRLHPDVPMLGDDPRPDDQHLRPPQAMNTDITTIPEEGEGEYQDGPDQPPPPPPFPPGLPRQRSRSRTPVSTATSMDSIATKVYVPDDKMAVPTDDTQRSRTPIPTARHPPGAKPKSSSKSAQKPGKIAGQIFGDKQHPQHQIGGSSSSTDKQRPQHQVGGSSSSTAPAPILPLREVHDIPLPDSSTDEESDETESLPSTVPGENFEFLQYLLTRSRPRFRKGPKKFRKKFGKFAPRLLSAFDEALASQASYLAEHRVAEGPFRTKGDTAENDFTEIELSSDLARLIYGDTQFKVADDEIVVAYVSKKTKNVSKIMVEKTFDILSAEDIRRDWKLVETAIRKEVNALCDMNCFIRAKRSESFNVLSSRFVHKYKLIDGERLVKSRLVVRGFEDLAQDGLDCYAGTAARWSQRLIASVAAQKSWRIFCWDVSVAFLQGMSFSEISEQQGTLEREVSFSPPHGSEKYFREVKGMQSYDSSTEVFRMVKAIYGLKDAPRAWKLKLEKTLLAAGGRAGHTDKNLWTWHDEKGKLTMILSSHVDDLKGAAVASVAEELRQLLIKEFGPLKEQWENFTHCGIEHVTEANGDIVLHQRGYTQQIKLLDPVELAAMVEDAPLSVFHTAQYQSLLGALSWLTQTRMDVCIYVCALQRAAKAPRTEHAHRLQKVAKWVRRVHAQLTYKKFANPARVITISDSAFRKESLTGLAIRGAITGIGECRDESPGGVLHVIDWYSRKQRRVTRSTYSAELNGLSDAVDFGKLICITLSEVLFDIPHASTLIAMEECGNFAVQLEAVVDAKSVYDSLASVELKPPSEQTLVMMLCGLKESLLSWSLRRLWWCQTEDMVSDGLNKGACSRQALITLGNTGRWDLKFPAKSYHEFRHIPIPSSSSTLHAPRNA